MTNGITNDEATAIGNFIDEISKLNIANVKFSYLKLFAMEWINIENEQPKDAQDCKVKTTLGRELDAVYYDCWGTFQMETEDYPSGDMGWKDNGENPELVTHWKPSVAIILSN